MRDKILTTIMIGLLVGYFQLGLKIGTEREAKKSQDFISSLPVINQIFVQNPPQVRYKCRQFCEATKYFTWEGYIQEYQKYMKAQ